jgi:hypothetical protein
LQILTSQPQELSPQQAARLLCECQHIVIIGEHQNPVPTVSNTFNALSRYYPEFACIVVIPAYMPSLARPNIRSAASATDYDRRTVERVYPQMIVGFLPDTAEHRRAVDAITRRAGAACSLSLEHFAARGPVLILGGDQRRVKEGAALITDNLRKLYHGECDDLSLH